MYVTMTSVLFLSSCLFAIGMLGVFLNKKNLIVILMSIELILLAANINFVAFSYFLNNMLGHIFVLFSLTVAAAESAIGLALLIVLFRTRRTINMEELNQLKG